MSSKKEEAEDDLAGNIVHLKRIEEEKVNLTTRLRHLNNQLKECEAVKYELKHAKDGSNVYQRIGTVFFKRPLGAMKDTINNDYKQIAEEIKKGNQILEMMEDKLRTQRQVVNDLSNKKQ